MDLLIKYYFGSQIMENEMSGECGIWGGGGKEKYMGFGGET